jgi:hypothetical protein
MNEEGPEVWRDETSNVKKIESATGHPLFGYEETPEPKEEMSEAEELHTKIWLGMASTVDVAITQIEEYISYQRIVAPTAKAKEIIQLLREQKEWVEQERKVRL